MLTSPAPCTRLCCVCPSVFLTYRILSQKYSKVWIGCFTMMYRILTLHSPQRGGVCFVNIWFLLTSYFDTRFSFQWLISCYFSDKFGVLETVELKEGGSHIAVTNANKVEYVKLLSEHRLHNSVRKQMQVNLISAYSFWFANKIWLQAFLDGFHELIPPDLIPMFSPAELELLM